MSDIAIRVHDIGKRYRIGEKQERYATLRDSLVHLGSAPVRWLARQGKRNSADYVWALKNVSFEVKRGEVLGIIGRNGAGKSTLLKILSRITEPTEGYAEIHGRIGSLLEVGTGFHPELTGRENIYLSGAILGMKKLEIDHRFDEIVTFAGIEKFLDTPAKRYSSGMYTRLAFAVAAHLDPDILLIDEVLAVGDAEFQRKCLGKMSQVAQQGRTVLFVSHNLPAVLRLCPRVVVLANGEVLSSGDAQSGISLYLNSGLGTTAHRKWDSLQCAPGDGVAQLRSVRVHTADGNTTDTIDIREPVGIEVEYSSCPGELRPAVTLHISNEDGVLLFITGDFNNRDWSVQPRSSAVVRATCWIPGNFLAEGRLFVRTAISSYNPHIVHASEEDAVSFQVVDRSEGDGVRGGWGGTWPGVVRPMLKWKIEVNENQATRVH